MRHYLLCIGILSVLAFPELTDLFFFPRRDLKLTPAALGLSFDEVNLKSADDVDLHGWELPAVGASRGYVLFLHGNAENISNHLFAVHWLPAHGFTVMLFDYRGYGRSTGRATVAGAIDDSAVALSYAADRAAELQVPLVVYGQSLGGALAVTAVATSARLPAVSGMIVDSSFASYREIARDKLGESFITWIFKWPVGLLVSDRFAPERFIDRLKGVPLLFLHGEADPVVPLMHGERLFQRAAMPKQLWRSAAAGHLVDSPEYRERLLQFLGEVGRAKLSR